MSLNGKGNLQNSLLTDIKANGTTANATLTTIDTDMSGDKSVHYRLDQSVTPEYRVFGLTSTRLVVDNSQFWANEMGIPVGSLDITFPAAAATVGMASSSDADNGGTATGSLAILIEGLDTDFLEISEVLALSGQTKVTSVNSYIAINNATSVSNGSTGWNEGTIYIGDSAQTFTAGVPQTSVYRTIGVDALDGKGIGASNPSTYTIPAGFTACPVNFKLASDASAAKPLLIRGIVQPFGIGEISIGNLAFGSAHQFTFDGFANLTEKGRVIVRSRAATATSVGNSVLYWEWVMRRNL